MAEPTSTMSAPQVRSFDYSNLRLRAISAGILIPVVLFAVWVGDWLFRRWPVAAFAGAGAGARVALLAREWAARMAAPGPDPRGRAR